MSSPVEVAVRSKDDTRIVGVLPLGRAREGVQDRLVAARIQLVHRALTPGATEGIGPVKIADRVENHACKVGLVPIKPSHEGVQHRLIAGRIEFEHHAQVRRAAIIGSPVELAGRVADHTGIRVAPIGPAREAVQHRLMAGGIDLEHYACSRCATIGSRSVEVAGRVAHHTIRVCPIVPAREGVQHCLIAGRIDFEHHARARRAAIVGRPVEVADPGRGSHLGWGMPHRSRP